MQEADQETYGPDAFETGDLWYQAQRRKPLDWSDHELELFVDLMKKMMQFQPELRHSTAELLRHEWFRDMQ
jgi:serine/threonine protein kinase